MEPEPKDVIILSAISRGAKKFNKIEKMTKIHGKELNDLLERLQKIGLIMVSEKKGFFGPKIEIVLTDKGKKELEERRFELEKNWNQMVTIWKNGDKQKLQQYMDEKKDLVPSMMFLGIMDMIMFSTMLSFMGMALSSYIPDSYMATDTAAQTDASDGTADMDHGGGDFGHDSGFDIDVNF